MDDKLDKLLEQLKAVESRLPEKEKGWDKFLRFVEKLLLPVALGLLAWFGNQAANRISEGQLRLAESAVIDRKEEFRRTIQAKGEVKRDVAQIHQFKYLLVFETVVIRGHATPGQIRQPRDPSPCNDSRDRRAQHIFRSKWGTFGNGGRSCRNCFKSFKAWHLTRSSRGEAYYEGGLEEMAAKERWAVKIGFLRTGWWIIHFVVIRDVV